MTRHYPENSVIEALEEINAVVCRYFDNSGRPCALAYCGRMKRPAFRHWFSSVHTRELFLSRWVDQQRKNHDARERAKRERKEQRNAPNVLKAGDILVNSWGYEQTNVDFFQVVESKGQTVKLRSIAARSTGEIAGHMSDHVVAVKDAFVDTRNDAYEKVDFIVKRVSYGKTIKMKFGVCSLWDGRPMHRSWYA